MLILLGSFPRVPVCALSCGRACLGHPDAEGTAFRQNALGVAPCPVDRDHRDKPGDDVGGCVDLIGTCSSARSGAYGAVTAGREKIPPRRAFAHPGKMVVSAPIADQRMSAQHATG